MDCEWPAYVPVRAEYCDVIFQEFHVVIDPMVLHLIYSKGTASMHGASITLKLRSEKMIIG